MDRYLGAHQSPNGPGDSRPTAEQIINDEELIGKLGCMTILVTGGTAGLGTETIRVLHKTGAKIFFTARNAEKGQKTADRINSTSGSEGPAVEYVVLDLGSLKSIRKGAEDFLSRSDKLNVLINNAGVMACGEGTTEDGFETQFGTNHIGHFLLFQLLKQRLLDSSTPTFNSRVVALSSTGHRAGDIQPHNYGLQGEYDPWKAYGQSKTANVLFANEVDRRYGSQGLHAWAVHPGVILETELTRHSLEDPTGTAEAMMKDPKFTSITKNLGQGAATQVWAAVAKALEGKGGKFLNDAHIAEQADEDTPMFMNGFAPYIYNTESAGRLWKDSLKMVNLPEDEQ